MIQLNLCPWQDFFCSLCSDLGLRLVSIKRVKGFLIFSLIIMIKFIYSYKLSTLIRT